MQSYYEINVSKNGVHLFATAERSCISREQYKQVLSEIKKKFNGPEYGISITLWKVQGEHIEL